MDTLFRTFIEGSQSRTKYRGDDRGQYGIGKIENLFTIFLDTANYLIGNRNLTPPPMDPLKVPKYKPLHVLRHERYPGNKSSWNYELYSPNINLPKCISKECKLTWGYVKNSLFV